MLDLRRRQFITLLGGPPRTYMDAKVGANRRNSTARRPSIPEGWAKCTDDNLVSAARSTAHWLVGRQNETCAI